MTRHPFAADPASLDRFLAAQADSYATALAELRRGRKQSHWMWFIFPQLRGLGRSPMSDFYGIADADEARRYLAHEVLGPRLIACSDAVLGHAHLPADEIMGTVDAAKLRSSATLFRAAGAGSQVFDRLLETFFGGRPCPRTLARLGEGPARKEIG